MKIVTTHKGTDFDGFASLIAGTLLYPGAVPVIPKSVNPNVKAFLAIHKELFNVRFSEDIPFDTVTQLIIVDTNTWKRLDHIKPLKSRTDIEIILWDHHPGGDIVPAWKCLEKIGATITLMIRQIQKEKKELTPILATLFLAGIYEDTGSLSFPSTTPLDAYSAAYLLEQRADLSVLSSFLKPAYNAEQKDVLFDMLRSAERIKVNRYYISCNIIAIEGHVGNLSVVVNMYRELLNVSAAFGIFVDKRRNMIVVIGRSITDDVNIGEIMRRMGGGGHPGAGSVMLKSIEPEAVKEMIVDLVKNENKVSSLGDLMSYPIISVTSDTPMKQVALLLRKKGFTGLPVVDDNKLVGIISRKDFQKLKKDRQMESPVKAFMSRDKIITVSSDRSPLEVAQLIVKHDIGRIPVIENGDMIGIITRTDVMRYFYDLLPE